MIDQAARALLIGAVVALPWFFGGVELKYHLALAVVLVSAFLLAALRFDRTSAALRAVAFPLVLLASAMTLGWWQITPAGVATVKVLTPQALEVAREFTAVPEGASPEPATTSLYPAATRWAIAEIVLVATAFTLGAALFAATGPLAALLTALAFTGGAAAFFGIIQKLSWNGLMYWSIPRTGQPFGPFVNRNNAGGFLTLCLASAVGLLVWRVLNIPKLPPNEVVGERLRRRLSSAPTLDDRLGVRRFAWFMANLSTPLVASVVIVTLIAGGILASLSRGSIVAMIGGGAIALLLTTVASRRTAALWLAGLAVAATAALVGWLGEWGEISMRLATLTADDATTAEPRLAHWRNAFDAARDFPLLGSGLGTYRFAYSRYERTPVTAVFHYAENQYLETLVIAGGVGFCILLLLIAEFARRSILLLRQARTSADFGFGAAAVGVLAMQAIHACFDFAWYVPANYLPLALVCGATMRRASACRSGGLASEAPPPATTRGRCLSFTVLALLVVALGWSIMQIRQARLGNDARRETRMLPDDLSKRNLNWVETALTAQRRAEEKVPDDGDTRLRMAELWSERYRFAFRREAQQNPMFLSLGPMLTVWETPAKLHADAHLLARVGNAEALDALRRHPLVVENLRPALEEAREARRICPLSPYPHLLVAQLCFIDESPLNDVFYLDRAERLAQGHDDWMFEIGRLHLGGARLERACVAWRQSWKLSDRFQDEILRLGFGYLTAEQMLAKVVPADPRIIIEVVRRRLAGEDRLFDRRVFCRRALELLEPAPPTSETLFQRGYCLAELGDLPAAARTLVAAVQEPRPNAEAFQELAAVQRALDDSTSATATAEAAHTLAFESIDDYRSRSRALELLSQAVPSAQTEHARATILLEHGATEEAIRALTRAVDLAPENTAWRLDLAELLAANGDPAAARRHLKEAEPNTPDDPRLKALRLKLEATPE